MKTKMSIPKEVFERVFPTADKCKADIDQMYNDAKFGEQKLYKQLVNFKYGSFGGTSLKALYGQTTIRGDPAKALAFDLKLCSEEITSDMPSKIRNGCLQRLLYYPNAEAEQYVRNAEGFKKVVFLHHLVQEIPVPLISNREFITIRFTDDQSANGKRRYAVYSHSCDPGMQLCDKVVRGCSKHVNVYEDIGNGQFTATGFLFCDPAGQIPTALVNMNLVGLLDNLIQVKQFVEN